MKLNNTYFILRHGQSSSNKYHFVSCWPEKRHNPLTAEGKKQIEKLIPILKKKKIDLIFSSDLLRAKQTAELIADSLGIKINFDKKLREMEFGAFNGKSEKKWEEFFRDRLKRFTKKLAGGENYRDVRKRTAKFFEVINKKYKNKRILIVSHGALLFSLQTIAKGLGETEEKKDGKRFRVKNGELRQLK
jgi:broad specificity phosphatase PhoE